MRVPHLRLAVGEGPVARHCGPDPNDPAGSGQSRPGLQAVPRPVPLATAQGHRCRGEAGLRGRGSVPGAGGGPSMSPPSGFTLEPDREQLARFVNTLFKHATEGGIVSLRAFYDDELAKKRHEAPFKVRNAKINGA